MRCGPIIAAALSLGLICAAPCAAQPEATKVALLAGINEYDSPEFSTLGFAERDADVLGDELRRQGFTVVVLKGTGKGDTRATKENIMAKLRGLHSKPNRNAVTLVALSGHGQQLRTKLADGQSKDENYFCPVDGVSGKAETLVSLSEITDDILRKYSGRNLLLIDACRDVADAKGRGRTRGIAGKDVALPEGIAVLFSCRAEQQSYESPALRHGLFTYCVLEGLRGGAALRGKDTVDWDGLASFVKRRLSDDDMRKMMFQGRQDAITAGGVEFTVLTRVTASASAPPVRPVLKSEPPKPLTAESFVGTWKSDKYGTCTLTKGRNQVDGRMVYSNGNPGTLAAIISGRSIRFNWAAGGDAGSGELTLSSDGSTLSGYWKSTRTGQRDDWVLRK